MATSDTPKNSIFLMIVGALIAVGSFLPWGRVGFFSVSGTEGDGIFTLVGGAALFGIGWLEGRSAFSRVRRVVAFFISGLCALIAGSVFNNMTLFAGDTTFLGSGPTPGGGLVLVLLGSVVAVVASFVWMFEKGPSSLESPPMLKRLD